MKLLVASFVLLLPACAVNIYHPTRTAAEMKADIDQCTRQANKRYWMDGIAGLYNAYDCLEAKGYQRDQSGFPAKVERALGEAPRPGEAPRGRGPCVVPCKP